MKTSKSNAILVNGSLRVAGVTLYTRGDKTIMRVARSRQPKRRSRKQFDMRERMAHSTALWRSLKWAGRPLFTGGDNTYQRFATLANKLTVVYLTAGEHRSGASLLLPSMPLSDGTLPDIGYRLGEVGGQAALLTDLPMTFQRGESVRFYTLRQTMDHETPRLGAWFDLLVDNGRLATTVTSRDATLRPCEVAVTEVEGRLALTGAVFADPLAGWGLVREEHGRCSSQQAVTRCTYYERYTTAAALQAAAESYGGLTD